MLTKTNKQVCPYLSESTYEELSNSLNVDANRLKELCKRLVELPAECELSLSGLIAIHTIANALINNKPSLSKYDPARKFFFNEVQSKAYRAVQQLYCDRILYRPRYETYGEHVTEICDTYRLPYPFFTREDEDKYDALNAEGKKAEAKKMILDVKTFWNIKNGYRKKTNN